MFKETSANNRNYGIFSLQHFLSLAPGFQKKIHFFWITKEQGIWHLTSDYRLYKLVPIDYID